MALPMPLPMPQIAIADMDMIVGWALPAAIIFVPLTVFAELFMPGSTGAVGRVLLPTVAFLGVSSLVVLALWLIGMVLGKLIVLLALLVGAVAGLAAGAQAASEVWHRLHRQAPR